MLPINYHAQVNGISIVNTQTHKNGSSHLFLLKLNDFFFIAEPLVRLFQPSSLLFISECTVH